MRRTLIASLILVLGPIAAQAQCSGSSTRIQAMSCVEGSQWNAETGTCVPVVTG